MFFVECLWDLLFPRRCEICGRLLPVQWRYMCEECLEDIPLSYYWDWVGNPAEKRLWVRCYLQRVVPLFLYSRESKYTVLIHKIKYRGNIGLGRYMGRMLGERLKGSLPEADLVIPIPLHPLRWWKRGYNQAEVIAEGVAEAMFGRGEISKRVSNRYLRRARYTKTQTKQGMNRKWSNVSGVFKVFHPEELEGKHILIVDDVLTSGATAESAYTALTKVCKDCKVSFATLGYVE